MLSLQPRSVPPSSLLVEEERVEGEGKERQACSAAPALNPLPISIVSKRRLRYPPPYAGRAGATPALFLWVCIPCTVSKAEI